MQGNINIQLEGIGYRELERCRDLIHMMLENGVFNVRNGKVILHFDSDATIQQIEYHVSKWRRNKESLKTLQVYEDAKVSIANN